MRYLINKANRFLNVLNSNFELKDYVGKTNINLGCGNKPLDGFVNVDYYNKEHAQISFDLNCEWPFEDESVDLIYSDNVFEHLPDTLSIMKKCYRCLRPGSHLIVKVPYFKSKHAFVDPTHVKFFTIQSMDYFVNGTYFNAQYRFFDESFATVAVFLDPSSQSIIWRLLKTYAILKPNSFENNILSNFFVFHNIIFVMKK